MCGILTFFVRVFLIYESVYNMAKQICAYANVMLNVCSFIYLYFFFVVAAAIDFKLLFFGSAHSALIYMYIMDYNQWNLKRNTRKIENTLLYRARCILCVCANFFRFFLFRFWYRHPITYISVTLARMSSRASVAVISKVNTLSRSKFTHKSGWEEDDDDRIRVAQA